MSKSFAPFQAKFAMEADTHVHRTESELKTHNTENKKSLFDVAKDYAKIIDSRESITRIFLECTADIPWILSAALRNKLSFIEAVFECILSNSSFCIAPWITEKTADIVGSSVLSKENQKDVQNLLYFYREELENEETFNKGVARVLVEEPADKRRIAELYKSTGKFEKAKSYEDKALEIENYYSNLKYSPELLKEVQKLKEYTIVGESSVEGFMWGTVGLVMRFFRSVVLKQNRFTGTKKYLNDKDAEKLGEAAPLALWQKILGGSMAFFSPIANFTIMRLAKNKELIQSSSWLKKINEQLDMFHGLFPKLGLMFSYTSLPKWISTFITSQGRDELIERVMKYGIVGGSWWMGHRLFNGSIGKHLDKRLSEKYSVPKGILINDKEINHSFPEPAKIHQVFEKTKNNPELRKDAEKGHWKTLYHGLGLHSLVIFAMCLLINQITKWRVHGKQEKLKAN